MIFVTSLGFFLKYSISDDTLLYVLINIAVDVFTSYFAVDNLSFISNLVISTDNGFRFSKSNVI